MRTFQKIFLPLITVTIITAAAVTTSQVQTQSTQPQAPPQNPPRRFSRDEKAEYESQFPVADYESAEPEDSNEGRKRRARNRRHNGQGLVAKPENSGEGREITRIDDWEMNLPTLPVAQSDLVVLGEVTDARAYLSEDKQGVYSEFPVRADEVLMGGGEAGVAPGDTLIAERVGGRVRFPSGVIELSNIAGQGMPRAGQRYVLFLKSTGEGQVYRILTGYEVREGRILPLDKRGSSRSKFDAHRGVSLDDFLQTVRDAVTRFGRAQKGGD